jgi:hypothetical protein
MYDYYENGKVNTITLRSVVKLKLIRFHVLEVPKI